MTDITKCESDKCPLRKQCYRHLAPDGMRQSYANFYNYEKPDGCKYYVHIAKELKNDK